MSIKDKTGFKPGIMQQAIDISISNVACGCGPFGAVIAQGDKIISATGNTVTRDNDPTAHAEINAIRLASKKLGTFDLSSCQLYSSCEPCPMCLSAAYWARIPVIYYSADRDQAAAAGFLDAELYRQISLAPGQGRITMVHCPNSTAQHAFESWSRAADIAKY
jgi:guanine deaminase